MSDQPQPVVNIDVHGAVAALARLGEAMRSMSAAFDRLTGARWDPYSSPAPLGIDGRAYTRRRRARARRGAFA